MTSRNHERTKPRIRPVVRLGTNAENRLRSYTVAAKAVAAGFEFATIATSLVCTTGFLISAPPSVAEVVYTPANKVLNRHYRAGESFFSLDLNNDGQADFTVWIGHGYSFSSGHDRAYGWAVADGVVASNQVMQSSKGEWQAALQFGAHVGPAAKFQSHYERMNYCAFFTTRGVSSGPWRAVTNRYLGLKFQLNGEIHYGWARVSDSGGCNVNLVLTGYAYETEPGKPIVAGPTPFVGNDPAAEPITQQPISLGALAAGASARLQMHKP